MNGVTGRLAKKLSKKFNMGDIYFHIKPGDTVIDVGACTGDMTYYYSWKVGNNGRVIALEPSPAEMRHIDVVTRRLKNVSLIQKALYKSTGTENLYLSTDPSHNSLYSDFEWNVEHSVPMEDIPIDTISLDDLTKNLDKVDLIAMNIEGAEYDALLGGDLTLTNKSPKLNIYVHNENDLDKIKSILNKYNYNYRYLDHYLYASKKQSDFELYKTDRCDNCNCEINEFECVRFDGVCKSCYLTFLKEWLNTCLN